MLEILQEIFSLQRVRDCLSTDERSRFLIEENETTNVSQIIVQGVDPNHPEKCLIVNNPNQDTINHISIDGCFLTPETEYFGEKCDLAVFNNEKFCFVELKTNAYSSSNVGNNLRKARRQLGATINYFDNEGVDFSNHNLEAIIVLRNNLYPSNQAGINERRRWFYDEYEVDLFERREITF